MPVPIGGLRAMATGGGLLPARSLARPTLLPARGQKLTLCRGDQDLDEREVCQWAGRV